MATVAMAAMAAGMAMVVATARAAMEEVAATERAATAEEVTAKSTTADTYWRKRTKAACTGSHYHYCLNRK